ncbi:MAG: DNA-binding response OmpR family regulator [Candidatus Azotimanducaceae bacterium]|jgi:DNA-binding response OmpR family regulator
MNNVTILVIENETDLREAITVSLETESFTVLQASDGEEGYQTALREHPDVILLDIMMPKMNGHEALEKIRNDPWGKDAKVIFLSSMSDAENVVRAVEKGSEDYIVKSHASLEEIVSKVKQVLHGYDT